MHQQPLLSVIFTVCNQRDIIESTLTSVLEMSLSQLELIVINDGSSDGSGMVIQSLLDHYQHEQAYYFVHEQPAGRANCLNEGIQQATGKIVWFPPALKNIDENTIRNAASTLVESDALFAVQGKQFPDTHSDWTDLMKDENWPDDSLFLWNKTNIPSAHFFTSPHLTHFHATELACRLSTLGDYIFAENFFEVPGGIRSPKLSSVDRLELTFSLLRRGDTSKKEQAEILKLIDSLSQSQTGDDQSSNVYNLLKEVVRMKQDGRLASALELIENILSRKPDHPEAKELKIEILEKKRRFVEASELKHEMDRPAKKIDPEDIVTSIIIPTTLYGKPALEQCLLSVDEHCDPSQTELIIIDNASLDDTHDYLDELQQKNFFNCNIITNKQNRGFAASVNQGLDAANGDFACIMHNDIQMEDNAVDQLKQYMELYPQYAIIGPMTDKTLNPDQSTRTEGERSGDITKAEYLDSFCMMLRLDTDLRMDESYQLAFFEDIDLCFQARKEGYRVGIANDITVRHYYGTSTFALNLDTDSEQYWRNVAYFNKKWGVEVYSEEELKSKSTFDQLLALDNLVNPLYPEKPLKEYFRKLFTDELKTELLRSQHDEETLCRLVHLMMVMGEREVMRRLEDRLDSVNLPASLIYQLVRFYFKRNIYSRCLHYLDKLKAEQQSLQSELYRLEIMVNEKDLKRAVPKLTELLDEYPSNPHLYKLAGDIHNFDGNEEEANSFYNIAAQIDPFSYSEEDESAFKLSLLDDEPLL